MKKLICLLSIAWWVTVSANHTFEGQHLLLNLVDCNHTAIRDRESIKHEMLKAIRKSKLKALAYEDFYFDNGGYTLCILLSESHATVHTYPECDSCFIDVFGCGKQADLNAFEKCIKDYFSPQECSKMCMIRNQEMRVK